MNNATILKDTKNFDVKQIFECGQAFRFNPAKDGGYEGVAYGKYLRVTQSDADVTIYASQGDVDKIWHSYFDLDRDYESIIKSLSGDEVIRAASLYGSGIRILNQDTFECLISFIISQSNNIPRIKGIIERLCENFGGREELKKIYGVGDKVANCVLLFGAGKADAFPIDTWIKKAIAKFYKDRDFDPSDFGPYCGLAQQYLFYYARGNKI